MNGRSRRVFLRVCLALILTSFTLFCLARPAQADNIYSENFDGVTAPALPFGMIIGPHTGTASWATNQGTRVPPGGDAYSPSNLLYFNSADCSAGDFSRLHVNLILDVTPYENLRLVFEMYHDSSHSDSDDHVIVEVTIDGGANIIEAATFSRYSTVDGWVLHTVDLSEYDGALDFRFSLRGVSAHGNDIQIDDLRLVGDVPACSPPIGTVGTRIQISGAGFGASKGQIFFGDLAAPVKVVSWTDSLITCDVKKGMTIGEKFDVAIQPKLPKGAPPIIFENNFTFAGPEIGIMGPAQGVAGDRINISGTFFGTRKGKIYLRQGEGETAVSYPCKVVRWEMNADDNESWADFLVPAKAPPGSYDLVLVNALGEDVITDALEIPAP